MPREGYENPADKGEHGDRGPHKSGRMGGGSDNESPSQGKQGQEDKKASPGSKNGGSEEGYDRAGIHGDQSFSGHRKSRSKNI